MKLTRKTLMLLGMVLGLIVANFVAMPAPAPEMVEILPAVVPDSVTRVTISDPIDKLIFERVSTEKGTPDFGHWRMVAPAKGEADAAQINNLLRLFGQGVKMEAKVDEGNLKNYGLEDQDAKLLEFFAGAEVPVMSVVVGANAIGATSFVRLPGKEDVYRADVGGRARLDRPPAEWRNHQVLMLDPTKVTSLDLVRAGVTLHFSRGPSTETDKQGKPLPGAFQLAGAPFPVDGQMVEEMVSILGRLRVGSFQNPDYEAGFDQPTAEAVLTLEDGTLHRLVLGSRSDSNASFLKLDDIPEVLKTSSQPARVMTVPLTELRDRTILRFDRADLDQVALTDGGLTVVLQPLPETTRWTVLQPANLDVDQPAAEQMVQFLQLLRADAVMADTSFAPSGTRLELRFKDGMKRLVEWGQTEKDANGRVLVRMRVSGKEGIYAMKDASLQMVRQAFGRG